MGRAAWRTMGPAPGRAGSQGRPAVAGSGGRRCRWTRPGPGPAALRNKREWEKPNEHASRRPERVGQEIQAAVGELLARGELRDPRIGFITITGVKMSPDLRVAKVFYSMIGTEERAQGDPGGAGRGQGLRPPRGDRRG